MFAAAMGFNESSVIGEDTPPGDLFCETNVSKLSISSPSREHSERSSLELFNEHSEESAIGANLSPHLALTPIRRYRRPRDSFANNSDDRCDSNNEELGSQCETDNFGFLGLSPIASQVGSVARSRIPSYSPDQIYPTSHQSPKIKSSTTSKPQFKNVTPLRHFSIKEEQSIAESPILNLNESHISGSMVGIMNSSTLVGGFLDSSYSVKQNFFDDDDVGSEVVFHKEPHEMNHQPFVPVCEGSSSHRSRSFPQQRSCNSSSPSTPSLEEGTTGSSAFFSHVNSDSYLRSASKSLLESFESANENANTATQRDKMI
jgi:hypothetical protein